MRVGRFEIRQRADSYHDVFWGLSHVLFSGLTFGIIGLGVAITLFMQFRRLILCFITSVFDRLSFDGACAEGNGSFGMWVMVVLALLTLMGVMAAWRKKLLRRFFTILAYCFGVLGVAIVALFLSPEVSNQLKLGVLGFYLAAMLVCNFSVGRVARK